jgi:Flp pilus assembly pilin Flp
VLILAGIAGGAVIVVAIFIPRLRLNSEMRFPSTRWLSHSGGVSGSVPGKKRGNGWGWVRLVGEALGGIPSAAPSGARQIVEYMQMKMTIRRLYRSLKSRKGQGLVEYSLILALVAVFALATLRGVGKGVNATLSALNSNLP